MVRADVSVLCVLRCFIVLLFVAVVLLCVMFGYYSCVC